MMGQNIGGAFAGQRIMPGLTPIVKNSTLTVGESRSQRLEMPQFAGKWTDRFERRKKEHPDAAAPESSVQEPITQEPLVQDSGSTEPPPEASNLKAPGVPATLAPEAGPAEHAATDTDAAEETAPASNAVTSDSDETVPSTTAPGSAWGRLKERARVGSPEGGLLDKAGRLGHKLREDAGTRWDAGAPGRERFRTRAQEQAARLKERLGDWDLEAMLPDIVLSQLRASIEPPQPLNFQPFSRNTQPLSDAELVYLASQLNVLPIRVQDTLRRAGISLDIVKGLPIEATYPAANIPPAAPGRPYVGFFLPDQKKIVLTARTQKDWFASPELHFIGLALDWALRDRETGKSLSEQAAWQSVFARNPDWVEKHGLQESPTQMFARAFNDFFQQDEITSNPARIPLPEDVRQYFQNLMDRLGGH